MNGYLRKIIGSLCIIIGIPGLILPFIPGIVLIITGVALLTKKEVYRKVYRKSVKTFKILKRKISRKKF